MDCRRSQELLSTYFDGELDSAMARRVEEHLARCTDCSEELVCLRDLSRALRNVGQVRCPDDLWTSLNQRIEQAAPSRVPARRQPVLAPAWSLAAAVALCAAVWSPQADVNFQLHSQIPASRSAAARSETPVSASANADASKSVPLANKSSSTPAPASAALASPAPAASGGPSTALVPPPPPVLQTAALPARAVMARAAAPPTAAPAFEAPGPQDPAPADQDPAPADQAPAPPVVPAARPAARVEAPRRLSQRFLAGAPGPDLVAYRPSTTVTLRTPARFLAPDAAAAPPSGPDDSTTSPPDSTAPAPSTASPSVSPTPDPSVASTLSVAENAATDSADLAQTGKDLYGMALEADGVSDAPAPAAAVVPGA